MLTRGNARWAVEKGREAYREGGPRGLVRKSLGFVEKRRGQAGSFGPVGVSASYFRGSLLMIAEPEPLQCWHYRVLQKQQACRRLGIPFSVVRPTSSAEVITAMQLASALIVYRQPDSMLLDEVLAEAGRLSLPVVYEADDIVYRTDLVAANPNLDTLPTQLREAVVAGAAGYEAALSRADAVLSSTAPLAADMAGYVRGPMAVVENGVDAGMWAMGRGVAVDRAAGRIRTSASDGRVLIGYGSGSRAHDLDLAVAAPALAELMAAHPGVSLKLMGPLAVPPALAPHMARIEQVGVKPEGEYMHELGACDIIIAPLLDVPFNHFKSQVKYLEAGLLARPMVASRTVYGNYIADGETGLVVDADGWLPALESLVVDSTERDRLGAAAADDIRRWDVDEAIAGQLAAALATLGLRVASRAGARA